jgi:hypothetical protein
MARVTNAQRERFGRPFDPRSIKLDEENRPYIDVGSLPDVPLGELVLADGSPDIERQNEAIRLGRRLYLEQIG